MTGQEFFKEFQVRIDKAYSKFVDSVKATRLFKRALYSVIDQEWARLDNQKPYDELRSLLVSDYVVSPKKNKILLSPLGITGLTYIGTTVYVITAVNHNLSAGDSVTLSGVSGITSTPSINGTFSVQSASVPNAFAISVSSISGSYTVGTGIVAHAGMLSDYLHLFSIACKFEDSESYDIETVFDSTPIRFKTSSPTTIRSFDQIVIRNFSHSGVNGTFYVKHHNNKTYSLYYDQFLNNPVPGSVIINNAPFTPLNVIPYSFTVTSVSVSGNTVTFTTSTPHLIQEGQEVRTTGFGGVGYNTTGIVSSVPSSTAFTLQLITSGSAGTGTVSYYIPGNNSGGIVNKIYYRYAEMLPPDQKIQVLDVADVFSPKFETTADCISIMPISRNCLEAKVDYIKKPSIFINPTDNIFDLENVYPVKFLYRVISEAVILYSSPSRDQLLESSERRETQSNP